MSDDLQYYGTETEIMVGDIVEFGGAERTVCGITAGPLFGGREPGAPFVRMSHGARDAYRGDRVSTQIVRFIARAGRVRP